MVVSHFIARPVRFTLATLKFLCAVHLIQSHALQLSPASGPSMLPTFSVDGDWIAADMTHARNRRRRLRVGDLVVYRIPISPNEDGIKRLIGLPGDYVSMGTPGERGEERMIQVGSLLAEVQWLLTDAGSRRPLLGCRGQSPGLERL